MTLNIEIDKEISKVLQEVISPVFDEINRLKSLVSELKEELSKGNTELLSKMEIAQQLKIAKNTLDTKIREGKFPKPDLYLGPQNPRWKKTTILKFLEKA